MYRSYQGGCHCGRVRFELQASIDHLVYCNCSICRIRGATWHGAKESELRIVAGEDELVLYQFGTGAAKHYFCRHCGIHTIARPRLDPSIWVVNALCIDDLDASTLPVHQFNGANWDQGVREFMANMQAQQAA